ncbi:hypothetical protein POTOM_034128 [Populus tomentosa]|uniref:Uncharacterized protein n=1 Tax=Populus tomentosa TaxID=118781 RepID=A0A8X8CNS8_POPTO|nr:hypothetical protein POTOM_034128 [Populus tomentosa]
MSLELVRFAFSRIDIYSSEIELNCEKLVLDDPDEQTWATLSIVFKPQHNSFTGNHEIIVLIAALQEKDKSTVAWHDRRNAASNIVLDGADDTLFAIVLNFPVRLYAGLWKSRRWITSIVIFLSLVSSKILKSFYALALKDLGLNEIAHFGNEALNVAGANVLNDLKAITLLYTITFYRVLLLARHRSGVYDSAT